MVIKGKVMQSFEVGDQYVFYKSDPPGSLFLEESIYDLIRTKWIGMEFSVVNIISACQTAQVMVVFVSIRRGFFGPTMSLSAVRGIALYFSLRRRMA